MRGCDAGAAWHGGAKVGECGALATTSPNSGTILLEFDEGGFTMTPPMGGAEARATPHTVSAHMLYENSDPPYILHEPGGYLDVTGTTYEALDARRVRVTGSRWVPSDRYTVKLEGGARAAGYQVVSLVLVRDPRYVDNIDAWCADIQAKCSEKARARVGEEFTLELRVIGRDATLGALDPAPPVKGSEVAVMGVVTAPPTEALAREIAKMLNPPYLLHHPLTEQEEMPTFAFPFSPPEMPRGWCMSSACTMC